MNEPTTPNRRALYLALAGIAIIIALILPFVLRDAVARLIVEPVARFWWAARQIFRMVPQTDLWIGLILLAALNFTLIFARRVRLPALQRPLVSERGRIIIWREQLAVGQRARRLLVRPLLNLVVQTVAQVREQPDKQVREDIYSGRLDMPANVQRFLAEREAHPQRNRLTASAKPAARSGDIFADLDPAGEPSVDDAPPRQTGPLLGRPATAEIAAAIDYMEQLLGESER